MEIIRSSSWAEVLFEGGERTTVRISVRETDNNVLTYHKIECFTIMRSALSVKISHVSVHYVPRK